MANILIAGVVSPQRQHQLLATLATQTEIKLTVYTPQSTTVWPEQVTVLTGTLTDQAGLAAAVLDQDAVLVQLDSKALVAQTQSLITVLTNQPRTQLLIASPDSILSLTQTPVKWYRARQQRRQLAAVRLIEHLLQQSQRDFTLIEGTTAATTAMYTQAMQSEWLTALPTRRSLELTDYLTTSLSWPLTAA